MSFTLLQVEAAQQATNSLLNYGPLGIFVVLVTGALGFIFNRYSAQHEKQITTMQAQIDGLKKDLEQEKQQREDLENKFQDYLTKEREEHLKLITSCEKALNQNSEALLQVLKKL